MTTACLRTVLSLGGNLGDVAATFRQAENLLIDGGFAVEKTSSLFPMMYFYKERRIIWKN